jgi:hypothetical protein
MRRATSRALSVMIVAGLIGIIVKVSFNERNVAADGYATKNQIDDLHVALPYGLRNVPAEIVALP